MKKKIMLFLSVLVTLMILVGCQSQKANIEDTLLGTYPKMDADIKQLVKNINNDPNYKAPKLKYGKMKLSDNKTAYVQDLLVVVENKDRPIYKLQAWYDLDKNLKEIYYRYDIAAEKEEGTEASNLLYAMISNLSINDNQLSDALLKANEPNTFTTGDQYTLSVRISDDYMCTVKIQGLWE